LAVAGAVCANEIAASARVIEKAVMVFIVLVRVLVNLSLWEAVVLTASD
jgi:hypothetical protein